MGILNERIKQMRIKCGLTLSQIADKLDIREATMQRYESGEIKNIKRETISQLAEIFHCSPSYLMGWEDETGCSIISMTDRWASNPLQQALSQLHIGKDDLTKQDICEIVDYVQLLRKRSFMLNAAHERTDMKPTKEDRQIDEDIMDDENF